MQFDVDMDDVLNLRTNSALSIIDEWSRFAWRIVHDSDPISRYQYTSTCKETHWILEFITRSVNNKYTNIVLQLYASRWRATYTTPSYFDYRITNEASIPSKKTKMTRLIPGVCELPYRETFMRLSLHYRERGRVRGDWVQVLMWMRGITRGIYESGPETNRSDPNS